MKNRSWHVHIKWKPQNAWVGLLWKRDGNCLDMWICIFPCLPIHFSCWGEKWGMASLDIDDNKSLKRTDAA